MLPLFDPWTDDSGLAPIEVASDKLVMSAVHVTKNKEATPAAKVESFDEILAKAEARFELGDFSEALALIQRALALRPGDAGASDLGARCEQTLLKMYQSKLGDLRSVPRLKMTTAELMWLSLDPRAGFVLSQVDGIVTIENLMTLIAMPQLETFKILVSLLEQGAIEISA